jgi:hypothetical protein
MLTLMPMPVHSADLFWGWVFLIGTLAILAGIFIWWLWCGEYKTRGMVLPLVFMGTAFSAVLIEPVFDNTLLYWYPPENPLAFFIAFGRTLPWYVPLGYAWLFGGGGYLIQRQFEKGISKTGVWKLFGLFILFDWLATGTAGWFGLSAFYGNQPFVFFGGCPLWFCFVDATGSFAMAIALHQLLPWMQGTRRLWLLILPSFTYGATLGSTTAPVTLALNSGWPTPVVWAAGAATMLLCCCVVWAVSEIVTKRGTSS